MGAAGKAVSYGDVLKAIFESAPKIISTAAASFEGLVALSVLALAVLVGIFLIVHRAKAVYFLIAIGLFIFGTGLFLYAAREGLQRKADTTKLDQDGIVLAQDRTRSYKHLLVKGNTRIVTNGHRFQLKTAGDLTIEGELIIQSFPTELLTTARPALSAPPKGGQGINYDFGPNTNGRCNSCNGRHGGNGAPGQDGARGLPGHAASDIEVKVGGKASGKLVILAIGGAGQNGQAGGEGGDGGSGEQGGRGTPGVVGCISGPGWGGRGGNGGIGGQGASGGSGGAGGHLAVRVQDGDALQLEACVAGGLPGVGGTNGVGGRAGSPGLGGRGSRGCQDRVDERIGQGGRPGPTPTIQARRGNPGPDGQIMTVGIAARTISRDESFKFLLR